MKQKTIAKVHKFNPRFVNEDFDFGPTNFSMSFRRRELEMLDYKYNSHWYINPAHNHNVKEKK